MDRRTYLELMRSARIWSRRETEAEDLLQTALVAALEARRGDMARADNRRWLIGVLRNKSRQEARSAIRRRRREAEHHPGEEAAHPPARIADAPVQALPPALRATALLALTGHTRAEIGWLLNIPDTALRKRISEIRRRWAGIESGPGAIPGAPRGELAFGRIRQALIGRVREPGVVLGSHDPDGNLFVVTSQNPRPRRQQASDI